MKLPCAGLNKIFHNNYCTWNMWKCKKSRTVSVFCGIIVLWKLEHYLQTVKLDISNSSIQDTSVQSNNMPLPQKESMVHLLPSLCLTTFTPDALLVVAVPNSGLLPVSIPTYPLPHLACLVLSISLACQGFPHIGSDISAYPYPGS